MPPSKTEQFSWLNWITRNLSLIIHRLESKSMKFASVDKIFSRRVKNITCLLYPGMPLSRPL